MNEELRLNIKSIIQKPMNTMASESIYILQFATSTCPSEFCLTTSDNTIHLCKIIPNDIEIVGSLRQQNKRITDICFPIDTNPSLFLSSSEDGSVICWDLRTRQVIANLKTDDNATEIHSVSGRSYVIGAGSEGNVYFWDLRKQLILNTFSDMHESTVSQVKFHPEFPNNFFSASTDGLICVFDFSYGLDEDESFKAAQNVSSINEIEFYDFLGSKLACQMDMNGLMLWDWKSAINTELEIEGAMPIYCNNNILMNFNDQIELNLIGIHYCNLFKCLFVLIGDCNGNVCMHYIDDKFDRGNIFKGNFGFEKKHDKLVRCSKILNLDKFSVVTGAEDSNICLWQLDD